VSILLAGVRDLYELLLQKEALENRLQQQQLQGQHEIVRKSSRTPALRLRFGRRADPMLTVRDRQGRIMLFGVPRQ
jgi:hypothetical protein